jgi:hypothetical protein
VPLTTIRLKPGVVAEITPTQGVAQIVLSQLIRFKFAGLEVLAEKLGGWTKFYNVAFGSICRALHAWEGFNNDTHLAAGCLSSLNVITAGSNQDITPRTALTNPAIAFSTTSTSPTVEITDAGFSPSVYDSIYLLTPVAVGGLLLQGAYQVFAVVDSTHYEIIAASNATSTVTNGGATAQFATTNTSPGVTVTLANHGLQVGDLFNVAVSTTVGGILFSGAYLVQSVPSSSTFTINGTTAATSTTTGYMNGGNARIEYFVVIAPLPASSGYGTGTYGTGGYGTGTTPVAGTGTPITTTNWTLDNWGEVLLACPTNGPIYTWSPDSGFSNASKLLNAPLINGGIFVAQPAEFVIAWASSNGGVQDPLSINWCSSGDYTVWNPTSQDQAGGYRLPTGSRIVGGISGPSFNVIWTDVDVWAMDYIEPPLIFGFNSIGSNCGLIGRHAMAVLNSVVYWMSNDKFCLLNGETVQTIPCSVWDFVFQDLDTGNLDKITGASNSLFGEIAFYFPSLSGGTGEIDSYVKFNVDLNVWDFGRLDRTAWIDQSPVGKPIGAGTTNFLYQHETSPDADGQPMNPYFESGFFEISEGENLNFVDWILPDFKWGYYGGSQAANVQITLGYQDYPNDTNAKTKGPYTVTDTLPYVNMRLRGRLAKVRVESSDLGSFWRMGALKMRSVTDGKR